MAKFKNLSYRTASSPAPTDLAGAEIVAIEQAERYNTDLVIMENGQIVHISPQEMRRRLGL